MRQTIVYHYEEHDWREFFSCFCSRSFLWPALCAMYLRSVIRKEQGGEKKNESQRLGNKWTRRSRKTRAVEWMAEKNAREDNRFGVDAGADRAGEHTTVFYATNFIWSTLGISTLIKMFDLFSFFISLCCSLISFLPCSSAPLPTFASCPHHRTAHIIFAHKATSEAAGRFFGARRVSDVELCRD